jgi:glycosyltransferase involved in cell wall biosynthesis
VRLVLPGTVIRLAGQSTPGTEASADPPDVVVTGLVADMTDELARADVVVVPLRSGSGTRLKILEAMAHGVPVVSTTIGAEGLDVQDGVHLLVADTAEAMVAAVERLQDDPGLRARLVANARARFDEGYEDRAAADRIHDVVDSLRRDPGRGR